MSVEEKLELIRQTLLNISEILEDAQEGINLLLAAFEEALGC